MPRGLTRGLVRHVSPPSPHFPRTDPLDRGLVGEWRFDPATGSVLPDFSGRSGHGDISGATWAATECGLALDFESGDAADEVLVPVPAGSPLDITGALTIETFVNPESWGEGDYGRICQRGGNTIGGYGFYWGHGAVNQSIQFATYSPLANTVTSNANVVSLNTWQHTVVSYDGTNAYFYVDEVAAGSGAINPPSSCASSFYIGSREYPTHARWFDGLMGLLRIYNRALSAAEIRCRYEICLKRAQPMTHVWMIPFVAPIAAPPTGIVPVAMRTFRNRRVA